MGNNRHSVTAEMGTAPLTPNKLKGMIFMRKRTFGINIRVTEQEKKRIEKYAKKCKLSISEYLRQLANGYTPMIYERSEENGNDKNMVD